MRIYGRTHGEQALETVLTDTVVFTLLSERKLGPKLHGIFPGGRIEQYIPVSSNSNKKGKNAEFSWKESITFVNFNSSFYRAESYHANKCLHHIYVMNFNTKKLFQFHGWNLDGKINS